MCENCVPESKKDAKCVSLWEFSVRGSLNNRRTACSFNQFRNSLQKALCDEEPLSLLTSVEPHVEEVHARIHQTQRALKGQCFFSQTKQKQKKSPASSYSFQWCLLLWHELLILSTSKRQGLGRFAVGTISCSFLFVCFVI